MTKPNEKPGPRTGHDEGCQSHYYDVTGERHACDCSQKKPAPVDWDALSDRGARAISAYRLRAILGEAIAAGRRESEERKRLEDRWRGNCNEGLEAELRERIATLERELEQARATPCHCCGQSGCQSPDICRCSTGPLEEEVESRAGQATDPHLCVDEGCEEQPAIHSHPVAGQTVFAWLIERGQKENHAPTVWWAGESCGEWSGWTADASKARRFGSRQAAEAEIAAHSRPVGERFGRAVEHGFSNLGQATEEGVEEAASQAKNACKRAIGEACRMVIDPNPVDLAEYGAYDAIDRLASLARRGGGHAQNCECCEKLVPNMVDGRCIHCGRSRSHPHHDPRCSAPQPPAQPDPDAVRRAHEAVERIPFPYSMAPGDTPRFRYDEAHAAIDAICPSVPPLAAILAAIDAVKRVSEINTDLISKTSAMRAVEAVLEKGGEVVEMPSEEELARAISRALDPCAPVPDAILTDAFKVARWVHANVLPGGWKP